MYMMAHRVVTQDGGGRCDHQRLQARRQPRPFRRRRRQHREQLRDEAKHKNETIALKEMTVRTDSHVMMT